MEIQDVRLSGYAWLIIDGIKEMIRLAGEGNITARHEINGVMVMVNEDSDADIIYRDFQRTQSGYIQGVVGPYPKVELTADDIASDDCIRANEELKAEQEMAEYFKKQRAILRKMKSKLAKAPAMKLADEAGWQKSKLLNSDSYGKCVMEYAERWARLMQIEMDNGKNLEDVAEATSREADIEGITGFMYGCAVSHLAWYWEYGDQLRRWHNLDIQIGNEGEKANESGGVLNPALLSIS